MLPGRQWTHLSEALALSIIPLFLSSLSGRITEMQAIHNSLENAASRVKGLVFLLGLLPS